MSKTKIITISGHAQSGKDTSAIILKYIIEGKGKKVLITHYASLLKFICHEFFSWDGKKDERGRSLLQYVGTDVIRNADPDFWVGFLVNIFNMFDGNWDYIIIPDCRFPNECDILKENGFDTTHLRIKRSGYESPLTEEQRRHPSETALDNITPDFVIDNCGTSAELKEKLIKFVEVDLHGLL